MTTAAPFRFTIPACRCSDYQLTQVGCDCEHERAWIAAPKDTVAVWPRGYAAEDGTRSFKVLAGTPRAEVEQKAREIWGSFASVAYVTPAPKFGPPEHFSPEYIRMMSRDS
jgi:hypothetical protein